MDYADYGNDIEPEAIEQPITRLQPGRNEPPAPLIEIMPDEWR